MSERSSESHAEAVNEELRDYEGFPAILSLLQRTAGDGNGHHPDMDHANGGARDFTLAHLLRNGAGAGQSRGSNGGGANAQSPGSRLARTD